MSKLKKDGTPKLSGYNSKGRNIKNINGRTKINFYADVGIAVIFCKLSADEKNDVVRSGLALRL